MVNAGGPYTDNEGSPIPLTGSASDPDGDPLTFAWSANSPVCTFSDPIALQTNITCGDNGDYTATLIVNDGVNEPVSSSATITINNVAPVVGAGGDRTVNEGDLVTVNGTFVDPGSNDTHTFRWQVAADNGQAVADGTTQSFSFTPFDNGIYTLTFIVTDDDGGSGSDSTVITVNNVAPVADAGPYQTVQEEETVTFTGSFTDPGSNDTHTFRWRVKDDEGDVVAKDNNQTFSFTPDDEGVYTVIFVVTDDDGDKSKDKAILTVIDDDDDGGDDDDDGGDDDDDEDSDDDDGDSDDDDGDDEDE